MSKGIKESVRKVDEIVIRTEPKFRHELMDFRKNKSCSIRHQTGLFTAHFRIIFGVYRSSTTRDLAEIRYHLGDLIEENS